MPHSTGVISSIVTPPDLPVASRKINRERVVLLGWAPAILAQLAHPLVAAGVADHSSFRASPIERAHRLRSTIDSMLALTFGSQSQAEAAAARINAIHDRVNGALPRGAGPFPTGTRYSAHDPELLRWVHATLLDTLPRAYEQFVGPLTDDEKDRYCLEATGMAPLLGVRPDFFPASQAALRAYMQAVRASGQLVVTATAREIARAVLFPPAAGSGSGRRGLAPATAPFLFLARLPAVGLLAPDLRRAYGLRWTPRHAAALRFLAAVARRGLPVTPLALRHWPAARDGAALPGP
jgi:uncharacterized protein (DUF2236 family)